MAAVVAAAALVWLVLAAPVPRDAMVWAGLAGILVALVLGAPVFVALGGAALLLFWGEDLPVASLALDHYRLVVNPSLPAIPLFTLAGYFLAESGAPKRLIRVFNALFGGVRGGAAAVAICAGAFFTAFTGASGVTILALGGLLMPLLIGVGQSERNALGLMTSSGSLGVLLPPSLPLILYAIVAKVPMEQMFLGALLPGLVLMALLFALGWRTQPGRRRARRAPATRRGPAGAVGSEVGAAAAGGRLRRAVRRFRHAGGGGCAHRAVCVLHHHRRASRPAC